MTSGVAPRFDHLVIAAPELERGARELAARLGAPGTPLAPGGSHPGLGTRNALLSLGGERYLELIAPDPEQQLDGTFGAELARLPALQLLHWAIRSRDLEALAAAARGHGLEPGPIREMSRRRPDGALLAWRLMGIGGPEAGGAVPFAIDWLETPHPAASLPAGVQLASLRVGLPAGSGAAAFVRSLALEEVVVLDGAPSLHATLDAPAGRVELEQHEPQGFRL